MCIRDRLLAAFQRFLADEAPEPALDSSHALPDDIHEWSDYLWIGLTNDYLGDADKLEHSKDESVDQLLALFADWRVSPDDFAADCSTEYDSAGRVYVRAYEDYVNRLRQGGLRAALLA